MKSTLSLSFFLLIIFTLTLLSPPSTAEEDDCDKFACDDDWNHVKIGQPYRIGPTARSTMGGIYLDNTDPDKPCPLNAMLYETRYAAGDFFIITPTIPNDDGLLPLETPFSISSAEPNSCNQSGIWRTMRKNKTIKFWHITADGKFNTSGSCFQVVPFPDPTDLPYTPSYLLQSLSTCGLNSKRIFDVGNRTTDDNFGHYLTTSKAVPLELTFQSKNVLDRSI